MVANETQTSQIVKNIHTFFIQTFQKFLTFGKLKHVESGCIGFERIIRIQMP
jgi:hypothetical protein